MESWVEGGVTAAQGFAVASVHAGVKPGSVKKDVVLLCALKPAVCAGVFTRNKVKAAPVLWCQKTLRKKGICRALLVNSGNANACTGEAGFKAVRDTAQAVAKHVGCTPQEVCVASTGVIGVPLPVERMLCQVPFLVHALANGKDAAHEAAKAIMTTDLRPKEAAVLLQENGQSCVVGGMAKGSGMIHPNMATMLGFITTDAVLSESQAQRLLKKAVDETFNTITVDGDTSTNDSVFLLASGASGLIVPEGSALEQRWYACLKAVCVRLAEAVVLDGEGAKKLFSVTVKGAQHASQAAVIARTVASSSLVKTAVAGGDPNWGRVLAAAGRAGVRLNPHALTLWMGGFCVALNGEAQAFDEKSAAEYLKGDRIDLVLSVGDGQGSAVALGCDLTEGYVHINAHYRS